MFHPSLGDINVKPFAAEFMGTFWLVLGGCGSAVLAAAFPNVGIGLLGVALAFGLTVLTMAYAIGHISGCHLNPAVTLGLWAGGRFPASGVLSYIVAQVLGGIAAAAVLYVIANGQAGFDVSAGFANGQQRRHLCGHAAGAGQRGAAVFQAGDAFLEHRHRRVADAAVDIAESLQVEQAAGVLGVVKHKARGLVDGRGARAGHRVGLGAGVDGAGAKTIGMVGLVGRVAHGGLCIKLAASAYV